HDALDFPEAGAIQPPLLLTSRDGGASSPRPKHCFRETRFWKAMFYSRGKAASKAVTINLINSPDVRSRHSLLRRTCPLSGVNRTSFFAPRGSVAGTYHLAGVYTGRVLTGEKPGEPVRQSSKFEVFINLKTPEHLA